MTDVPDYVAKPYPPVHNEPPKSAQWEAMSQDQLNGLRSRLIESIIQVVVSAVTGIFIPGGGIGGASSQLTSWAGSLPLIGPLVTALTGSLGNLTDLGNFFNLANPINLLSGLINGVAGGSGNPLSTLISNLLGTASTASTAGTNASTALGNFTSLFAGIPGVSNIASLLSFLLPGTGSNGIFAALINGVAGGTTNPLSSLISSLTGTASTASTASTNASTANSSISSLLSGMGVGSIGTLVSNLLGTASTTSSTNTQLNQISDILAGNIVTPINSTVAAVKSWFDSWFGGGSSNAIPLSQKGAANGVAPLNSSTKIANTYLTTNTANGLLLLDGSGQIDGSYLSGASSTRPYARMQGQATSLASSSNQDITGWTQTGGTATITLTDSDTKWTLPDEGVWHLSVFISFDSSTGLAEVSLETDVQPAAVWQIPGQTGQFSQGYLNSEYILVTDGSPATILDDLHWTAWQNSGSAKNVDVLVTAVHLGEF